MTIEVPHQRITLLYGDIGKRKTTTACSLVNDRGLLIASDNSWIVLKKKVHEDLMKKIHIIPFTSLKELFTIDYTTYDTIIIDTFSGIASYYIEILLTHASWGGKYREKLIINRDNNATEGELDDITNIEKSAPVDYMVLRDKLKPVMDMWRSLEADLVFTSHVRNPVKGLDADMVKRPSIPQETLKLVTIPANIIGFMETMGKTFTVNVDEFSTYCIGKSQMDGISGKMNQTDFIRTYKELVH